MSISLQRTNWNKKFNKWGQLAVDQGDLSFEERDAFETLTNPVRRVELHQQELPLFVAKAVRAAHITIYQSVCVAESIEKVLYLTQVNKCEWLKMQLFLTASFQPEFLLIHSAILHGLPGFQSSAANPASNIIRIMERTLPRFMGVLTNMCKIKILQEVTTEQQQQH